MSKNKLSILDADGFIFFAGWEFKEQLNMIGELGAKEKIDKIIEGVLEATNCTHYIGFFGKQGEKNFRHDFATIRPYKGTRGNEAWQEYFKPILRQHFIDKWGFYPVGRIEADDAVIIAHHQFKNDWDIIHVSEDKDQKQLGEFVRMNPNRRSNPSQRLEYNEHEEGRKFFWGQCISGDGVDNIQGIEGQGKASKLITQLFSMINPTEEQMFNHVRDAYFAKYGSRYLYHLVENYILLNMLVKPIMDYPKNAEPRKVPSKNNFELSQLIDL